MFGIASRARAEYGPAGLLVSFAAFSGSSRSGSWRSGCCRTARRWTALVPGAALFAVGVQVVHLGTALFIAGKVERASETYGSLGVAFTILVWLYVVSRVIVASAMLNAALWEQRTEPAQVRTARAEPQVT